MNEINRRLAEAVTGMDAEETRRLARLVIDDGLSPISAIENGLAVGMTEVGRLFVAGEIFVPEVLVAVHSCMKVFGLSVVTDMCLPDNLKPAVIDEIIAVANSAQPKLEALVMGVLQHHAKK